VCLDGQIFSLGLGFWDIQWRSGKRTRKAQVSSALLWFFQFLFLFFFSFFFFLFFGHLFLESLTALCLGGLVAIIADEDTVTGFLLAGVGKQCRNNNNKKKKQKKTGKRK
jgi:hypothetical protein